MRRERGIVRRWVTICVIWGLFLVSVAPSVDAQTKKKKKKSSTQTTEYPEYEFKAAALINFARIFDWPATTFESPTAPLVIGVLGHDPFGEVLDELVAKANANRTNPRRLRVERFTHSREVLNGTVHLLFIGKQDDERLAKLYLTEVQRSALLTVGETPDFLSEGGCITLLIAEPKPRIFIENQNVKKAELQVPARLTSFLRLPGELNG